MRLKRAGALAAMLWLAIFAIINQLFSMELQINFLPALKDYWYATICNNKILTLTINAAFLLLCLFAPLKYLQN